MVIVISAKFGCLQAFVSGKGGSERSKVNSLICCCIQILINIVIEILWNYHFLQNIYHITVHKGFNLYGPHEFYGMLCTYLSSIIGNA